MSDAPKSRLFLLRHAHSSWALPGQRDHERPLDARGEADAPAIGAEIAASGYRIEHVVCSSAVRALQTFAAVRPFLHGTFGEETSDDLYALGVDAYHAKVRESAGRASVMLVGHNPMIEEFAMALAGRSDAAAEATLKGGFPTAGLAVIEFDAPLPAIEAGAGFLARLLDPKSIARNG